MSELTAPRRLLLPLVPLYRLGQLVSQMRPKSPRRLAWPVVSIGNLSTGGAGKTPLTIALAKSLTKQGLYVDVLSRGYGRATRGTLRVHADGTAEEFGDEPLLIAREAGVPIYVAAERYEAGMMAEQEAQRSDGVHLLDDGFQHRQLARNVDILIVQRSDLADHLLPAGNLREPLSAMHRANILAIAADDRDLEQALKARGWSGRFWHMKRKMEVPQISGPVVAFCGIARPEQFFAGLANAGLQIASRIPFRDHHRYIEHDIDCLKDAAHSVKADALVTTEKDRVRLGRLAAMLPAPLALHTAQLSVEIEDGAMVLANALGLSR